MEAETIFVLCDCHGHALAIGADPGCGVEIAMWRQGGTERPGFMRRMRHISRIIRYGHPYADNVIFSEPGKIQQVIDALQSARDMLLKRADAHRMEGEMDEE